MVMTEAAVEKELKSILQLTEKGPDYVGDWKMEVKITKEHATGMPWETAEEKKNSTINTTASKQVYTIHVSTKKIQ